MTAQRFVWLPVATTADERAAQLRHEGVRDAVALLGTGNHLPALGVLLASVEAQARLHGIHAALVAP